ncbi:FAD/NAD(P)-binding protein [Streptomyces klenkii]
MPHATTPASHQQGGLISVLGAKDLGCYARQVNVIKGRGPRSERVRSERVIAVVGAGASGILTTTQLIAQAAVLSRDYKLRIQLFDHTGELATGPAYGTPHECHILNMRAATMSMYADRPDHFLDWLGSRIPQGNQPVSGDAYIPRAQYGVYLREQLHTAVEDAHRHGIEVEFVTARVTDCLPGAGKALVQCGDVVYSCDAAVLCSGDLPGKGLPQLAGSPAYLPSAWQYDDIAGIPSTASVAVIGSSLTAVDVIVLLDALGHQGEIRCFSRLRSLPKVQEAVPTPWKSRYVTEERVEELTGGGTRQATLTEVAGLFRQEIELATGTPPDWDAALRSARRPVAETLPEDIRDAAEGRNRWYAALDATGHLAPRLWHRMDDAAKEVFLAKHASLWAMYRHSMPLPNAEKLWRLVRAGQLHAHTGLRAAVAHGGRHTLTCVEDGREREFGADYVVNATGASPDITELDDPLIGNLRQAGRLRPHRHGGVDVDFGTGRLIGLDGTANTPVYFVGPLTRGVHFYTNSVETLRTNSAATARSVLRGLG